MVCHNSANRRGRDFVMFVTFDASPAGRAGTGDAAKLGIPLHRRRPASRTATIKELTDFVQAMKSAQ